MHPNSADYFNYTYVLNIIFNSNKYIILDYFNLY